MNDDNLKWSAEMDQMITGFKAMGSALAAMYNQMLLDKVPPGHAAQIVGDYANGFASKDSK